MAITYDKVKQSEHGPWTVRLDGKETGRICMAPEGKGYVYMPKGNKKYAGEAFPTLDACKRSIEGKGMTYEEILNRDVPTIKYNAQAWARQGICASIRIYYMHEAISGMSSAISSDMEADGWKDSGVEIPSNIPYDKFWSYLYQRLMRVPIFA